MNNAANKWFKAWQTLGAVIAHVPSSAVMDDEQPVRCAVTSSGAVRVDADGERVWYYRRTRIEHMYGGTDPRTGQVAPKMYRTRGRGFSPTLGGIVSSIDSFKSVRQ